MKILILSIHNPFQKNKAGTLHLLDAYCRLGYDVSFICVGTSLLSFFRRSEIFKSKMKYPQNKWIKVKENFNVYFLTTLFHPVTLPFITKFVNKFNRLRELLIRMALNYYSYVGKRFKKVFDDADYVVFESSFALCFATNLETKEGKYIYRVSDDMSSLSPRSTITEAEEILIKKDFFKIISVPYETLFEKFSKISSRVRLQRHAVNKTLIDKVNENPYMPHTINAVYVGVSFCDSEIINVLAKSFPHVLFHVIGRADKLVALKNIRNYGLMSFEETLKYIKFCDVALQTIHSDDLDISYLRMTNKIIQYQ